MLENDLLKDMLLFIDFDTAQKTENLLKSVM